MTIQATRKSLYVRPPDRALPLFGLDVDNIQTESIFFDSAIYSAITTTAYSLGILSGATISHCHYQIHDKSFKEPGRACLDSLQQLLSQFMPQGLIARLKNLFRGLVSFVFLFFVFIAVSRRTPRRGILGEPCQEPDINLGRLFPKHFKTASGNTEHPTPCTFNESGHL